MTAASSATPYQPSITVSVRPMENCATWPPIIGRPSSKSAREWPRTVLGDGGLLPPVGGRPLSGVMVSVMTPALGTAGNYGKPDSTIRCNRPRLARSQQKGPDDTGPRRLWRGASLRDCRDAAPCPECGLTAGSHGAPAPQSAGRARRPPANPCRDSRARRENGACSSAGPVSCSSI